MANGDKRQRLSGSETHNGRHFKEHELRKMYDNYVDHEEERELRTNKIRKTISYEEFCGIVLQSGEAGSNEELEADKEIPFPTHLSMSPEAARSRNLKKLHFDEDVRERLYNGYLHYEADRFMRTKETRKTLSYEEYCLEMLGMCYVESTNEVEDKEPGKEEVLGSGGEGSKDEVEDKEPGKEEVLGSGGEGSKDEVEDKEPGKEEVLGSGGEGSKDEVEDKEPGKEEVLGSGGEGSKDDVEDKEPGKEEVLGSGGEESKDDVEDKEPGKEEVLGSGGEGSKDDVETSKTAKDDTQRAVADTTCDEEREENTEFESKEITWELVVKPGKTKTVRNNVLQIPRHVIRTCLSAPQDTIELFDTDTGETYQCEMGGRDDEVEKYLCRDWYRFAKDRDLRVGDVLSFCIRYPPATRILVCVER